MLRDLIQLVFPAVCPGCTRNLMRQDGAVCFECLMDVRHTGFHAHPNENEMYNRLGGRVPLAGAGAFLYFDKKGKVKRMVQALKYKNQPRVGSYLGEVWAREMKGSTWWESIDHLVPVPLHGSRQRERGYNQAEAVAKGLARIGPATLERHILHRRQKTTTQTRQSKQERWKNVAGKFEVKSALPGHVAIVDDVLTTGATLEACIRAFLECPQPPEQISVLCLAMASND